MPHTARKKSETGFYHVVTKGDGGQIIFEDEDDRLRFLRWLRGLLGESSVVVHAYCLMSNHVHLLIQDPDDALSGFMKALDERYAMYFAKKTGRVGHVFQDRFWSEPVEGDERFLATLRYIHANPEHAGLCKAEDYRWSSYKDYVGTCPTKPIAETAFAISLLGCKKEFVEFQKLGGQYAVPFRGSRLRNHLSDDELVRIAIGLIGRERLYGLRTMPRSERVVYVSELIKAGFSETQISRLTGIGQPTVHKLISKA